MNMFINFLYSDISTRILKVYINSIIYIFVNFEKCLFVTSGAYLTV
jgi:hypothetical protein